MPTPEELARINIDKQLEACGWIVQDRAGMNLYAARGVTGEVESAVEVGLVRAARLRQGENLYVR